MADLVLKHEASWSEIFTPILRHKSFAQDSHKVFFLHNWNTTTQQNIVTRTMPLGAW